MNEPHKHRGAPNGDAVPTPNILYMDQDLLCVYDWNNVLLKCLSVLSVEYLSAAGYRKSHTHTEDLTQDPDFQIAMKSVSENLRLLFQAL